MSSTRSRIRHKRQVSPPGGSIPRENAQAFFEHKLAFETDPADVHADLEAGVADFVVVDARQAEAYRSCRIPGAVHLPWASVRERTTRRLDPAQPIVTYCWGPGCNAAAKAAARLAQLGFSVREMIGGLEYWRREGYAVEGDEGDAAPLAGSR